MAKELKTEELAEIIFDAIKDEPYFNKEVLVPKIKALITGFRLRLSTVNYNKVETPGGRERYLRQIELVNWEANFWKCKLREAVGEGNMQPYFDEQVKRREQFINPQPPSTT